LLKAAASPNAPLYEVFTSKPPAIGALKAPTEANRSSQEQPAQPKEPQPTAPKLNKYDRSPKPPKSANQNVEETAKAIRRVMNRIANAYGIPWCAAEFTTPKEPMKPITYDNPLLQRVYEKWLEFKAVLEEA
jgi:hypothetical protein